MKRVFRFVLCFLLLCVGTAATAQAGYLYVLLNDAGGNRIYGFSVNETTGATALLAGFPVNTGGTGGTLASNNHLTIDQKNNRLYAINDGTDRLSAYSIDPATGALTALPFSPIALGSGSWIQLAVHPSGSPLIISTFQGSAYSYTITATTAIPPSSPTSLAAVIPSSSVFSRDGNFFYTGGSGNVVGFSVNPATGVLTPLSGSPFAVDGSPVGYAMDAQGRLFLVDYSNARLRVFLATNGIPTPVAGNPFTGLSQSVESVLHPNGKFYFIVSRDFNQVGSYQIDGTGTATTLSSVTGSPFAAGGTFTNTLEINQAGTFLYAANGTSRNLTTYSVNPATGFLTNLAVQPVNTFGKTGFVTGMDYIPLVSVSGRVLTAGGRGVFGATVYVTDTSGNTFTARSNPAGYYRLAGTRAGETYTFTVRHKLFSFAPQTIPVTDNLSELNFIAEP